IVSIAPASMPSGGSATLTLTAKDANGNQLTSGGLTTAFHLGSGSAGGTFGNVTDNNNGTYTATFTATTPGTNTIIATIGGQTVTGAAPTVTVTPGAVSLAQSIVSIAPPSMPSGGTATVTLTAKDAN